MKATEFCYWLQGYFELDKACPLVHGRHLSEEQVKVIQQHLALVFAHDIDPQAGPPAVQQNLNSIHGKEQYRC